MYINLNNYTFIIMVIIKNMMLIRMSIINEHH